MPAPIERVGIHEVENALRLVEPSETERVGPVDPGRAGESRRVGGRRLVCPDTDKS